MSISPSSLESYAESTLLFLCGETVDTSLESNTLSIFLFWTFSSSSIASEALVTFVNLIVESFLRYQAKQTFLLWPKWLVNQVNSASLMSSSCKTVDRYFLVRVGVIRWGFSRFSIFFVIDWRVSHSFR